MIYDNSDYVLRYFKSNYTFEEASGYFGSSAVFPNHLLALFFSNKDLFKDEIRNFAEIKEYNLSDDNNRAVVPYSKFVDYCSYLESCPFFDPARICFKYDKRSIINAIYFDKTLRLKYIDDNIVFDYHKGLLNPMNYFKPSSKYELEYLNNVKKIEELTKKYIENNKMLTKQK